MREIRPRCMGHKPYNAKKGSLKRVGYSSLGWLMPCRWIDPRNMLDLSETKMFRGHNKNLKKHELYVNMFKEELKLSNVESVEEIVLSTEWREFFEALLHDTEKVPEHCHQYCGVKPNLRPGREQVTTRKRHNIPRKFRKKNASE